MSPSGFGNSQTSGYEVMEFSNRVTNDSSPSSPEDEIDPLADIPAPTEKAPKKTKKKYVRRKHKVLPNKKPTGKFSCLDCDDTFPGKRDLRKHRKVHAVNEFECGTCGKVFNRQTNLKVHLRSHTQEKLFSCLNCNQRYAKKQNLDMHIIGRKCMKKPFACTDCSRSFELEHQLNTHVACHSIKQDEPPIKSTSKISGTKQIPPTRIIRPEGYPRGRFICDQCFQDYTSKANLDSHVRTQHGGDKPFVCPDCGRKFSLKTRLNFHRKVHTGVKPHLCSNCGKPFRLRAHLIVHERMHTGETPFQCSLCDKTFYQRAHLVSHMRKHTGDTPFSCPHCEKAYTRAHTLKNHIDKSHPPPPKTEPSEMD